MKKPVRVVVAGLDGRGRDDGEDGDRLFKRKRDKVAERLENSHAFLHQASSRNTIALTKLRSMYSRSVGEGETHIYHAMWIFRFKIK